MDKKPTPKNSTPSNSTPSNQVDKTRIFMAGSAFAAIVAILGGWFIGIEPALAAASTADTGRAAVEVTNAAHAAVLAQLVEDSRDRNQLSAEFAEMTASIPDGTAIPDFVNQLDTLADANGLVVSGLAVADAQAYTPSATVVEASITAQSLAALEVTVSVDGDYDQVLKFVDGVQSGARLFLVTGISTHVDDSQPDLVDATITGLVYVLVPPGSILAPVVDPALSTETDAATAEVG